MDVSQIVYIVIMLTCVDGLFQQFAPPKETDGWFFGYIRTFTRCFVLFLVAYIYISNVPTPTP